MHAAASRSTYFLILPDAHLLDLSGAAQVLFEADGLGGAYRIRFCSPKRDVLSAQGLQFGGLDPLPEAEKVDLLVIPGTESSRLDRLHPPVEWLRAAARAGAEICSICTGAFTLARAGLLDGRTCTTHWKLTHRLQQEHPDANVVNNRLFVRDGRILTSAGVAAGIDLALALVEKHHGPFLAARVAREIVMYMRRDGRQTQRSIYLDFRTHLHPGVHRVQDQIVQHPERHFHLDTLAELAGMSPRNLTRRFRELTGLTVKEYAHRVKLEVAQGLLHDPLLSVEAVAHRCGFRDARQLRRLWKQTHGTTPGAWRRTYQEKGKDS